MCCCTMRYLILFMLISHSIFAISLRDRLWRAEAGTYVVTEQNRVASLLHLHTVKGDTLLFEEISIPTSLVRHADWKEWAENGAHGHTSWILYEINLSTNQVTECYSIANKAWIPTDDIASFLIPLITLTLNPLSRERRMRNSPAAAPGQVEDRRPWGPPQIIHGKRVEYPEYDAFTATWPRDNSDLSGKKILLYFDKMRETFPFPFWIQQQTGPLKFKMRAIDSGTDMHSSITDIPRRSPAFTGGIKQGGGRLSLSLNIPSYYNNFKLYAVDLTTSPQLAHMVPFEIRRQKEETALLVSEEDLIMTLIHHHEYLWLFSAENPDIIIEFPHSFKWSQKN